MSCYASTFMCMPYGQASSQGYTYVLTLINIIMKQDEFKVNFKKRLGVTLLSHQFQKKTIERVGWYIAMSIFI